jgi:predicted ArsR family transcriptional regulator
MRWQNESVTGEQAPLGATRSEVLRVVQSAGSPVGVAWVASTLALHPNSARNHLEELVAAGFLHRAVQPSGAHGRPPAVYAATADSPTLGQTHLVELAQVLIDTFVLPLDGSQERLVEAGRAWGRNAEPQVESVDDVTAVARIFGERGFSALAGDGVVTFVKCPFRQVLDESQLPAACALHRGFIDGVLERRGSAERLATLLVGERECLAQLATVAAS